MPRSAQAQSEEQDGPARVMQMRSLLAKYSTDFPVAQWTQHNPVGENISTGGISGGTIVITGTTGCFGSHLLAQVLQMPDVLRVYALNRQPSGGDVVALQERQRNAFKKWRLRWDDSWLTDDRVVFHITDLAEPLLGLPQAIYDELQRTVTAIIHNAWAVHFAIPLSSYEPLISGTRNLMDLALGSQTSGGPRVVFVSSASALWNLPPSVAVHESLDVEPELAVSFGYAESKWVAEQLFGRAAAERGLRTTVVRVAQLSGDSRTGSWNTAEMIPAFVRACQRVGCVAGKDENALCFWVPVDIAAAALLEMVACGSNERVLHLTSPRPASWNDVLRHVAAELKVPLVPMSEFIGRLSASAQASGFQSPQTLKFAGLLEMYMARAQVNLCTERTLKISRTLSAFEPIRRADVLKWLSFWEEIGFLESLPARSTL